MQSQRGDEGSTSVKSYAVSSRKSDWGSFKIPVKPTATVSRGTHRRVRRAATVILTRDRHLRTRHVSSLDVVVPNVLGVVTRQKATDLVTIGQYSLLDAIGQPISLQKKRRWLSRMPIAWR